MCISLEVSHGPQPSLPQRSLSLWQREEVQALLPAEGGRGPPAPTVAQITDLHGKPKKRPEYPIGTVALYGPDDKTTTKIAAGVITSPNAEPIIRAVGGDRCDDEPEGPAGDEGVLRGARGQVGGR